MKIKLNRTYTTISVYILLVIAFALILGAICLNMSSVLGIVGSFLDNLSCLFFGLFFTFCFLPLVRFFERIFGKLLNKKKKHSVLVSLLSAVLVDILFLSVLVMAVVGIIPAFITGYNAFRISVAPQIEEITAHVEATGSQLWINVYHGIYSFFANLLSPDSGSLVTTLSTYAANFLSKTYDVAVGLVLATYFLVCRNYLLTLSNKFFTAFLPEKFRNATFAIVKRIYNFFVEFFSFRLVCGFALALLTYLLCLPFQIPYGVVIAVIVFVAGFVPVFGPIVATVGSTALIAVFSPSPSRLWQALIIFIILATLNILSALLFEPFFLRKKLRPGPGTVVTCVIVFYALFGFSGIIFAVPLYTSVDVAYREIQARLLVRRNLPLSNAYYLALEELPVPEKKVPEAKSAPDGTPEYDIPVNDMPENDTPPAEEPPEEQEVQPDVTADTPAPKIKRKKKERREK